MKGIHAAAYYSSMISEGYHAKKLLLWDSFERFLPISLRKWSMSLIRQCHSFVGSNLAKNVIYCLQAVHELSNLLPV